jgi:putative oxidoreductase
MQFKFLAPWAPQLLSVLRIMSALTFFTHGTQKLLGWPLAGPPTLSPMIMTAGTLELVGGALLAIGLFSRPVAFILSGLMACAYFIGHAFPASGF